MSAITEVRPPADRILELLGEYATGKLADIDQIVALAEARAREIPKTPVLARRLDTAWSVIGELVMRIRCLELEVAELRKAAKP
jgi:hypothetical protein